MKYIYSLLFLTSCPVIASASTGASDLPIYSYILEPLSNEFSGPLPILVGTIGLAVAAIAAFNGGAGQDGVRRFFGIAFGVGAALAAPTAIGWITGCLIP